MKPADSKVGGGEWVSRESVVCPAEELLAGATKEDASAHSSGALGGPVMMHLKAAQRYPTHEYAFSLLHDCMTAAEAATTTGTNAGYAALAAQILWGHGLRWGLPRITSALS